MASNPTFDARRGTWRMKYKPDPDGKWETVTLCKHPGAWSASKPPKKPPQEAIDRAKGFAEIEYRARHGLSAAPARAKSLANYLDDYVRSRALSTKSGSAKQLARHVKTFKDFAEARGITSIQGVNRVHCREYLEERIKSRKRSTLTTEHGYLIGAWTQAVSEGLLVVNPWSSVDVPGKTVEKIPTFWTSEEIGRISEACGKEWQKDLVLVLANTGLRISTGLALAWNWINWGEGEITIPLGVEDVKTSYPLSIGRVARDVLQKRATLSKGSPLVFPNPNPASNGGVIPYDSAAAAIDRAIKRAKVKHGTPHDLRHSCARNMILAGIPITIVQRQLGHTTLAMTQRYCSADAKTSRGYLEDFGLGDG